MFGIERKIKSAQAFTLPYEAVSNDGTLDLTQAREGEHLLGYDVENQQDVLNKIKKAERLYQYGIWYLINEKILLFENQSVFANGNVTHAKLLKKGDELIGFGGKAVMLTDIRKITGRHTFYRFEITGNRSYFVNGILIHNASRFWVGGAGNWDGSTTTHWSATSGGAGGASAPTSTDDVTFDTLSNATAYTVTIVAGAVSQNSVIGNPLSGLITLAGSAALSVAGNLQMASGMTNNYTGTITFTATSGTKTITSNGVIFLSSFVFNGVGGTFQLADNFRTDNTGSLTLTNGTFDPNGKTVSLGDSTSHGSSHLITGTFTFFNLTFIPNSAGFGGDSLTLVNNITVTGTLTTTGFSKGNRSLIQSSVVGTQRTITAAVVSIQDTDCQDIVGAGASGWNISANRTGDCGNNSGITFASPINIYWFKDTGNFSSATQWFLATNGGGGAARNPLPQDTAIFDANSFSAAAKVITMDCTRIGSIDFTGATNSPTMSMASTTISIYGSITLISAMVAPSGTQLVQLTNRTSQSITTAGVTLDFPITVISVTGTVTLQDNFTMGSSRTFQLRSGTFNANNKNVDMGTMSAGSVTTTRVLTMGSGTWTLRALNPWAVGITTGLTINANTSTIKFVDSSNSGATFAGNGFTYNNIWFARGASTGSITITGSNTFNDFKDDGSVAHSILFTAGITTTVTDWHVSGTAGNLITINSTTTATHALVKTGGGFISSDFLNIQHSVATPGATWYAGVNSTNNQAVATAGSGWIFTAAPVIQTKTVSAKARIKLLDTTKTISAKASIVANPSITKTIQAKARILKTVSQTVQAKSRIKALANTRTVSSKARIKIVSNTNTISVQARIKTIGVTKTISAKAHITSFPIGVMMGLNKDTGIAVGVRLMKQ